MNRVSRNVLLVMDVKIVLELLIRPSNYCRIPQRVQNFGKPTKSFRIVFGFVSRHNVHFQSTRHNKINLGKQVKVSSIEV
jgi:hypothetical protein